MRGCSHGGACLHFNNEVFPAGAGVFPLEAAEAAIVKCVPRRCGGVPTWGGRKASTAQCSPQVRGCSLCVLRPCPQHPVFPAGAGVFLAAELNLSSRTGVPRRCGGVPSFEGVLGAGRRCSPQVRGCSLSPFSASRSPQVFPAGAGVFPSCVFVLTVQVRVPRRCGGVPSASHDSESSNLCSPQVRGCSRLPDLHRRADIVFPAGAGVFLCA